MNSTGNLSHKASSGAAEYAAKRKEQMERAKQLREERKNGVSGGHNTSGSVFKNAGADFVHRGASHGRSSHGISQMSNQ